MADDGRFQIARRVISEVEFIERNGGDPFKYIPQPISACSRCDVECPGAKKCSGCKSVWYCSVKCQKLDWTYGNDCCPPHKGRCKKEKEYMSLHPHLHKLLKSFPWSQIPGNHKEFNREVVLARFRLLDISPKKAGYWSQFGGFTPHDDRRTSVHEYRSGSILLDSKLWESLNDQDGWKMLDRFIHGPGGKLIRRDPNVDGNLVPHLQFDSKNHPPPKDIPGNRIVDWDSWYQWRGLSKESPVALLMDFPLTVYWLLTKVLGIVTQEELEWKGEGGKGPSRPRSQLNVHCVGAELELNFLPIFSELALLIPNVDITLTFFGPSVYALLNDAKTHLPSSPAGKVAKATSLEDQIIYQYTAPESLGGSNIKMILYGKGEYWDLDVLGNGIGNHQSGSNEFGAMEVPHAVIAMNAGASEYREHWKKVILVTWYFNIPFAVTEYTHSDADLSIEFLLAPLIEIFENQNIPGFLASTTPPSQRTNKTTLKETMDSNDSNTSPPASRSSSLNPNSTFTAQANPFARIGQRCVIGTAAPNMSNGFGLKVSGSGDERFKSQFRVMGGRELSLSLGLIGKEGE